MNEWYLTDVPRVMAETDALYARIVEKAPAKTKAAVTVQRMVEERNWKEVYDLYKDRFEPAVNRLGCFYIPNVIIPGPAFVFPLRSADGTFPRAQTKPLKSSALFSESAKYRYIGNKEAFLGPNWLGNDPETIRLIIEKRAVMCVEGPFDLLAMRIMCPGYPILSPLTKRLGKLHISYLRLLGVGNLLLMYDNEDQGEEAMERQQRQIKSMQVTVCECPKHDPSAAIEKWEWAKDLSSRVSQYFGY